MRYVAVYVLRHIRYNIGNRSTVFRNVPPGKPGTVEPWSVALIDRTDRCAEVGRHATSSQQ